VSDAFARIGGWYAGRIEAARDAQRQGRQVIGCVGADIPTEPILAAGLVPLQLEADVFAPAPAAERFGTEGHPVLRSLVDRLLGRPYDFVDRVIVGTTPRNQSAIVTLLRELHARDPAFARFDVHLHDTLHSSSPSAGEFNRASLQGLVHTLERWSGARISDAALGEAIVTTNATRRLLHAFNARRADGQHGDGVAALQLHACATGVGRAVCTAQLQDWLQRDALRRPDDRPRALYIGSNTDTTTCYAAIERAGLLIVDDDQDRGARGVGPQLDEALAPLEALAADCHRRAPVPAGGRFADRREFLQQRIAATRPDAVVFWSAAYDHPPAWEYPLLRAEVEAAGLPHVLLDPFAYRDAERFTTGATPFVASLTGRRQEAAS
jgi:benzoyl-CoA reductase/2-hydroxyglutaryl-CoA dehydratase subunit BcrC/BadD/HgdB